MTTTLGFILGMVVSQIVEPLYEGGLLVMGTPEGTILLETTVGENKAQMKPAGK